MEYLTLKRMHSNVKLGLPSWFINQPDGSGPEGPLPHLEGAAGRDRTHVTPDEGCRSVIFQWLIFFTKLIIMKISVIINLVMIYKYLDIKFAIIIHLWIIIHPIGTAIKLPDHVYENSNEKNIIKFDDSELGTWSMVLVQSLHLRMSPAVRRGYLSWGA